jgi:hypothetical protein
MSTNVFEWGRALKAVIKDEYYFYSTWMDRFPIPVHLARAMIHLVICVDSQQQKIIVLH